jgi:hypothetical protein
MFASLEVNSLAIYPELGLLIFFGVFIAVSIRALRKPRSEISTCARLPLDETTPGVDDTKQERSSDR